MVKACLLQYEDMPNIIAMIWGISHPPKLSAKKPPYQRLAHLYTIEREARSFQHQLDP